MINNTYHINTIKTPIFWSYLLVYALIAFSGIPFFVGNRYLFPTYFILLIILFFTFTDYKKYFTPPIIKYFSFFIFIIILKGILQGGITFYSFAAYIIKIISPFIVFSLLKDKFFNYYIKILYVISIISLFFFTIFLFSTSIRNLFLSSICPIFQISTRNPFYEYAPSFILYTIKIITRNSGPFWEPGGFGGFLILGLLFNYYKTNKIINRQNVVFIISIITTFSTATYFSLFILLTAFLFKRNFKRLFIFFPLIFIAYTIFEKEDFLKDKVEYQWEIVQSGTYENKAPNRFSSAVFDLKTILNYPLLGKKQETIDSDFDIFDHRNNGISQIAAYYGIPFFLIYFYSIFLSFKKLSFKLNSRKIVLLGSLLSILMIYFGQVLTLKPVFILLTQIHLFIKMPKKYNTNYIKYK